MLAPAPNSSALPTIGSVLVVGGGVAGVQAALDFTELGLKVYLVEKSGAIGGVMARLDKTFPTNDCSLCILAPKLVEAGRDPNITILTKPKLIALSGEPGRFTAKIRKQPRYIEEEVCTGCAATTCLGPLRRLQGPPKSYTCPGQPRRGLGCRNPGIQGLCGPANAGCYDSVR